MFTMFQQSGRSQLAAVTTGDPAKIIGIITLEGTTLATVVFCRAYAIPITAFTGVLSELMQEQLKDNSARFSSAAVGGLERQHSKFNRVRVVMPKKSVRVSASVNNASAHTPLLAAEDDADDTADNDDESISVSSSTSTSSTNTENDNNDNNVTNVNNSNSDIDNTKDFSNEYKASNERSIRAIRNALSTADNSSSSNNNNNDNNYNNHKNRSHVRFADIPVNSNK
jgi:hypothetical protein